VIHKFHFNAAVLQYCWRGGERNISKYEFLCCFPLHLHKPNTRTPRPSPPYIVLYVTQHLTLHKQSSTSTVMPLFAEIPQLLFSLCLGHYLKSRVIAALRLVATLVTRSKHEWSYTSTPQYTFMAWFSSKAQGQLHLYLYILWPVEAIYFMVGSGKR
jgi:hypothetical protein